jgi:hypothetical protein
VRLIRRSTCPGAVLAYWVSPGETYSVAPINRTAGAGLNALTPSTMTAAYLNGVKLKVILDTGAESSLLSLAAAARAGVRPGDPGVRAAGQTHGIGRDAVETWIADFDSFKIGNEEIRHAKLRFGKMANMDVDMLLGADFFLSHRIFVANSQNKVYFTYNGGRVFDLSAPSASPTAQTLPTPPPAGAGPGPTAKDADAR